MELCFVSTFLVLFKPMLGWTVAFSSTLYRRCFTFSTTEFFFFNRHLAQCRRFSWCSTSTRGLVILLQEIPLLFWELTLDLLYDFLKWYPSTLRRVSLKILKKVLITTQWENVAKDNFKILLIMLSCEGLAIFSVEVFHYIFLFYGCHLTSVYMDTLARSAIHNLLNLQN